MPDRIKKLALTPTGFPTPWFASHGEHGRDLVNADPEKLRQAIRFQKCWVCGEQLGKYKCFCIGPMCVVNRITAEPPLHESCGMYSVRACPFLNNPRMRRNEAARVEDGVVAGEMIERNPGVIVVWIAETFRIEPDPRGYPLFNIGKPTRVEYYREGRVATRAEIMESIDSGMPLLKAHAHTLDAEYALYKQYEEAKKLLPAE
jgi:hypothetical protein